jgi:uncharacterized membrane protein YkoI
MKTAYLFPALVAGTISLLAPAFAGSDLSERQIRELVRQGRILPLERILERHREFGRLLDLEVEAEHGMIIYELEMLGRDGRVRELEIDAANGDILKQKIER